MYGNHLKHQPYYWRTSCIGIYSFLFSVFPLRLLNFSKGSPQPLPGEYTVGCISVLLKPNNARGCRNEDLLSCFHIPLSPSFSWSYFSRTLVFMFQFMYKKYTIFVETTDLMQIFKQGRRCEDLTNSYKCSHLFPLFLANPLILPLLSCLLAPWGFLGIWGLNYLSCHKYSPLKALDV